MLAGSFTGGRAEGSKVLCISRGINGNRCALRKDNERGRAGEEKRWKRDLTNPKQRKEEWIPRVLFLQVVGGAVVVVVPVLGAGGIPYHMMP